MTSNTSSKIISIMGTVLLATAIIAAEPGTALHRTGWNSKAKQRFMHPPTLTYTPVKDAAKYRCTVTFTEPLQEAVSLESATPEFDLTPVWSKLPDAGKFQVITQALNSDGNALSSCTSNCDKMMPFKGQHLPAACSYTESADKTIQWILKKRPTAYTQSFPSLGLFSFIRLFSTYPVLFPQSPHAKECIDAATEYAQRLLQGSTPADYVYAHMPPTHVDYKKHVHGNTHADPGVMLVPDQEVLQVARCGMIGSAYLMLYKATKDKTWLDAANRIADTLKKTQLPEGRWPFRVIPKDGSIVINYTSDQALPILLFDELIREHGRADLKPTLDKAVMWMLENPCRTYLWTHEYDDLGAFVPYDNLEFYDALHFIEYLLRHASPQNDYEKVSNDLMQYIEDQFVEWGEAPRHPTPGVLQDKGGLNQITPGVREQYKCYNIIAGHSAFYIRTCLNFYAKTKDEIWLKKSRAMADTLTAVQHPDGYYPTWMDAESQSGEPLKIGYKDVWPNDTAFIAEMLYRLDVLLKAKAR